jgi:hypothetical protein
LLDRARRTFPVWGEPGPSDSTFARIVVTAAQVRLAAVGLEPAFVPEVEWALPSFDLDHGGPSWLAGIETVVEAWLAAGEHHGAEQALDRMRARLELSPTTRLAVAVEALLRARLRSAQHRPQDASAEARRTLGLLGEGGPWWRAKAIRVLEDAGAADEVLPALAASLEAALGLAPRRAPEPSL